MNSPIDLAAALLRKARDDLYVVERLGPDRAAPGWVVGFHAQQAVEKAIKAALCARAVAYPRTHNLEMLIELAVSQGIPAPPNREAIVRLIPFGVLARYVDSESVDDLTVDPDWAIPMVSAALAWAETELARSRASGDGAG